MCSENEKLTAAENPQDFTYRHSGEDIFDELTRAMRQNVGRARSRSISAAADMLRAMGHERGEICQKLMEDYGLSREEAEAFASGD